MTSKQKHLLAEIELAKEARQRAQERGDLSYADLILSDIQEAQRELFLTGYEPDPFE